MWLDWSKKLRNFSKATEYFANIYSKFENSLINQVCILKLRHSDNELNFDFERLEFDSRWYRLCKLLHINYAAYMLKMYVAC